MLLEGVTIRSVDIVPHDEVHHLIHWSKVLVVSVLVLFDDEIVDKVEAGSTKWWQRTSFVDSEDSKETIQCKGVRSINVSWGDMISLSRPVYRIIVFGIEFL